MPHASLQCKTAFIEGPFGEEPELWAGPRDGRLLWFSSDLHARRMRERPRTAGVVHGELARPAVHPPGEGGPARAAEQHAARQRLRGLERELGVQVRPHERL